MSGNSTIEMRTEALRAELAEIIGPDQIIDDREQLELLSSDVYSRGVTAALAVRPRSREHVPSTVRRITESGFAVMPRGGGMSYTGGYTPERQDAVVIDTGALDRIVDINGDDMTITVEAGVTWKQIHEALYPIGLRLPFFGTFSGSRATVGGGMSNGALFFGTGRYGTGAEIVLGLEVVTADGRTIRTGQAGFEHGKPFFRNYGPDLTGLFIHDAGALGVKTLISMRLIKATVAEEYASFVFADLDDAATALSEVARSGAAEEAYILDSGATKSAIDASTLRQDVKRLMSVVKKQGFKEGLKLVGAGRNFVDKDLHSLHVVCSGSAATTVQEDLAAVRAVIDEYGGGEVANSMPKASRSNLFEPLNDILGGQGERWAALNCKVAHSDAHEIIARTDEVFARHADAMKTHGVWYTRLCIAISNHVFSFEPVLRWHDEWLPLHRHVPDPGYLRKFDEPSPNPDARALVDRIRAEIVGLFADFGAASNQIGRTYRYFDSLNAETASLVLDLKRSLDPRGLMNPGALGLPG